MKVILRMKIQIFSSNTVAEIKNAPKTIRKRKRIKTASISRSMRG